MEKVVKWLEVMESAMSQVTRDMDNLSEEEQNNLTENYPFDKSFDEVYRNVRNWVIHLKGKL